MIASNLTGTLPNIFTNFRALLTLCDDSQSLIDSSSLRTHADFSSRMDNNQFSGPLPDLSLSPNIIEMSVPDPLSFYPAPLLAIL